MLVCVGALSFFISVGGAYLLAAPFIAVSHQIRSGGNYCARQFQQSSLQQLSCKRIEAYSQGIDFSFGLVAEAHWLDFPMKLVSSESFKTSRQMRKIIS